MDVNDTGRRVLEFYEKMPFNYFDTPQDNAALIKKRNHVPLYFPQAEKHLDAHTSFLEFGCGTGWFSSSVAYYYKSRVKAIDFNPVAIDFAKKTADILHISGSTGVDFSVDDVFEFDTNERFDVAVSFGALHHTARCLRRKKDSTTKVWRR